MKPAGSRLHRAVLRAYPADFRQAFGDQMAQFARDRSRFDGVRGWRAVLNDVVEAVQMGPRLRWEESTSYRVVAVSLISTAAVVLAVPFGRFAGLPVVALAVVTVVVTMRRERPIARAVSTRAPVATGGPGIALLALSVIMMAAADRELSEPAWLVMSVAFAGGVGLVIACVVMAASGTHSTPEPRAPIGRSRSAR
jgi:hypothetical protein